jgi:hypothetical protein
MGLEEIKIMKRLIIILAILLQTSIAIAGFIGPTTMIEGPWGKGDNAFGFESGDTRDGFPSLLVIDEAGGIIIGDSINKRIKIYNAAGNLQANFSYKLINPTFGWPANLRAKANIGIFSLYEKLQKYDYNGNLVWAIDVPGAMDFWVSNDGGIWLQDYNNRNTYYLYSPTGQLIKTYTSRPPELGVASQTPLGNGQYKITVTYPDRVWSYLGRGMEPPYIRDVNGNLYSTGGTQAIRWNFCGKELARLTIPEGVTGDNYEEYGEAVVAPSGDVYTWKRTEDKYSILKWTWVDDPNQPSGPDAPANLQVAASTTGLYLTWTASPNDPGCVTGYEISRSDTSGGTLSVIATVDKGILNYNDTTAVAGTTYYYKLRAKSGTDFSAYTAEASGKR